MDCHSSAHPLCFSCLVGFSFLRGTLFPRRLLVSEHSVLTENRVLAALTEPLVGRSINVTTDSSASSRIICLWTGYRNFYSALLFCSNSHTHVRTVLCLLSHMASLCTPSWPSTMTFASALLVLAGTEASYSCGRLYEVYCSYLSYLLTTYYSFISEIVKCIFFPFSFSLPSLLSTFSLRQSHYIAMAVQELTMQTAG